MEERRHPSPAQIRAARALLDWSQQQLAARSGIGRRTVAAYEIGGDRVTEASITGMSDALMDAGISFSGPDQPEGVYRQWSGAKDRDGD